MTYTVVAASDDGSVGVATCSHSMFLASKTVHTDASGDRPLVVVSQAFSSRALGAAALAGLRAGLSSGDALDAAWRGEPEPALRQLIVGSPEGVAARTGERCVHAAGDLASTDGLAVVAGNMLESPEVVPTALGAYETSSGDFADRLLAALRAAHSAGGDYRGDRSGAILVFDRDGFGPQLTVDEHPEPVVELTRLLQLHRADVAVRRSMAWWLGRRSAPPADLEAALHQALPQLGETAEIWIELINRESGSESGAASRSARFTRSVQALLDVRSTSSTHHGADETC